ncbi:hypothetical protein BC628DRAFT_312743 [Trametes gibbosa]|nr:hypothetical protein BC628DRAFT_312743 [Trametes gibbosa]
MVRQRQTRKQRPPEPSWSSASVRRPWITTETAPLARHKPSLLSRLSSLPPRPKLPDLSKTTPLSNHTWPCSTRSTSGDSRFLDLEETSMEDQRGRQRERSMHGKTPVRPTLLDRLSPTRPGRQVRRSTSPPLREQRSTQPRTLGQPRSFSSRLSLTRMSRERSSSYESTARTSPRQGVTSTRRHQRPSSRSPNGLTCLPDGRSTSTMFLRGAIPQAPRRSSPSRSENWKSPTEHPYPARRSSVLGTGCTRGSVHHSQQHSRSPTVGRNLTPTESSSSAFLARSRLPSTAAYSTSIAPYENELALCGVSSSRTSTVLRTSNYNILTPAEQMFTEPSPVREPGEPLREESGTAADTRRKPADAITARTAPAAQTRPASVLTGTRAQDAEQLDTSVTNVRRLRVAHENAEQPRFLRGLVWDDGTPPTKCFAEVSLTHPPVPDVPRTIVTPVNVERFEEYLSDHPNQEFVKSVVRSLREGFWPYADAKPATYPDTWDEKRPAPHDENAAQFLRTQRDEEISLDRYSASFGCELLPGMYSMPIHVVPKPHSNKFRLVNNQSAGSFSLNSMIRPEAIKGAVLDGIPALGDSLRAFRRAHTGALIMWKSDVSQAYRRMPVSPFWQIRQAVTIDGQRYIDRCNLFGGRGSLRVWAAFDCLVSWIAEHKAGVVYKHNYVDDDFGFAPLGDVRWYEPYRRYFPTPQARLLTLWDELGVPHEPHKQLHATCLPVIGFDVDPNAMSVTLPEEGRTHLLDTINGFCMLTPGNRRRSLAEFQAFTGYANWAFNVYPLLKPALSNIYDKMAGKSDRHAGVYINAAIVRDLQWFRAHIVASRGIHLLRANAWTPADLEPGALGDEFALTDASSHGLGIYFPWLDLGFHCDLPLKAPTSAIFFFEALAVCAAIHRAGAWHKAGRFIKRLAVLSDNSNTVAVFNSLRASPPYNPILKSAVDIMLAHNIDVRVHHIAGKLNVIADALSRGKLDMVRERIPSITLIHLVPPQDAMGASL